MRARALLTLLVLVAVGLPAGAGGPSTAGSAGYRAISGRDADRWRAAADSAAFANMLKVNRLDLKHAGRARALIIPDQAFDPDELSPLPDTLDQFASTPRLILVSLRVQAFAAYVHGARVRWGPVSSGRRSSPTPAGVFSVNWTAVRHVSTLDSRWIMPWCVNIENRRGIALHQYDLPGRPASHRCVRLSADDARWVYHWVVPWRVTGDGRTRLASGTPVIVFGRYDFDSEPPWLRLPDDPTATTVTPDEVRREVDRLQGSSPGF